MCFDVFCKGCNKKFYGNNKKCKISYKTPARTCKGREKYGCTYCLCSTCFTTKLIDTNDNIRRPKRSQRAVVNKNE